MTTTAIKKIEALVEWMENGRQQARLEVCGGYPDKIDSGTIPGYVVVASICDDEPVLEIYSDDELIAWYNRAAKHRRKFPEESWHDAFLEQMQ